MSKFSDWKLHVENPDADANMSAISDTIQRVMELVYGKGAHTIRLDELDFNKVNPIHLTAVLRSTFSKRDEIVGWHDAVDKCVELFAKQGKNADRIMAGLRDQTNQIKKLEMGIWELLAKWQPTAEKNGYGNLWLQMINERTAETAGAVRDVLEPRRHGPNWIIVASVAQHVVTTLFYKDHISHHPILLSLFKIQSTSITELMHLAQLYDTQPQ